MKYLIFGDIHGKDLKKLEKRISEENPEVLVCLGDFDSVKSIREFMEIEKEFLKQGKKVYKVPGNHDYALLHGRSLESGTLEVSKKSMWDHYKDLNRDDKAKEYLFQFVNSDLFVRGYLDEKKFEKEYPFVVVHGGYIGNIKSCGGCSDELKPMWFRMKTEGDFYDNMGEMMKKNEKIMIRGHDHFPAFSRMDFKTGERETDYPISGSKFKINPRKQHIINPGAYFYRDYATIDTQCGKPLVEYKKDIEESSLDF
jgi:predicted phosphodiesterase